MTNNRQLRWFLLCLVLAALVGSSMTIGIWFQRTFGGNEGSPVNNIHRLEDDNWSAVCLGQVDVDGGVVALSPEQPGRIVEVQAREGESSPKGAVLLRMDDRPAQFMLGQASAALKLAKAQLAKAQNNLEQQPARIDQLRANVEAAKHRLSAGGHLLQRQRELLKISLTSTQEAAVAEDQLKELQALVRVETERLKELELSNPTLAVHEAQAKVEESCAALAQANYALDRCGLKAPEAGTVLRVLVRVGEIVGGPSGVPCILFCPDKPLLIRAEVEQEFVGRIMVGQIAHVEDEANPLITCRGQVTRIANWFTQRRAILTQPGQFKDVPTVECVIALVMEGQSFRLGQRVKVKIEKVSR